MNAKMFAAVGLLVLSVSAYAFDWKGTDGAVTIPAGTVAVITDDDIADVEALTSITYEAQTSQIKFTNTLPMTIKANIGGPGGGYSPYAIEMSESTGLVTFNGEVYFTAYVDYLLGNCVINGKFGSARNGEYPQISVAAGHTAYFSETASVPREFINRFKGPGTLKSATKLPTTSAASYSSFYGGTILCALTNLFNHADKVDFSGSPTVDLDGFDQTVKFFTGTSGSTLYNPQILTITSSKPAAFIVNQADETARDVSFAVTGFATYRHSTAARYNVYQGISTGNSTLEIPSGCVAFYEDARFRGAAIKVSGTGRFVSAVTEEALEGMRADIVLTDDAVLEVVEGSRLAIRSLTINGTELDLVGGPTVDALKAAYPQCAANLAGSGRISARGTFYVDAVNGNNANSGRTPALAVKTLSAAMALALPYDEVVALPGVYSNGVMDASGMGLSRVEVPENVTLRSRDGADKTFIFGEEATEPIAGYSMCGPDSARCVYLAAGARLRGFTLTRGYSTMVDDGHKYDGSAVYSKGNDGYTVDCVVTNCCSPYIGTCMQGKYLRCRVQDCVAKGNFGCGIRSAYAYNCTLKGFNNNGYVDSAYAVVNCTFDTARSGLAPLRGTSKSYCPVVYNSIFVGTGATGGGEGICYSNCIFSAEQTVGVFENCVFTNDTAIALDSVNWTIASNSLAVGLADYDNYLAQLKAAGFTEDEIEPDLDVHRGQRVYLGSMDAGASEYDPREDLSPVFDPKGKMEIAALGPSAVPDEAGIRLADGDGVKAEWKDAASVKAITTFEFTVVGGQVAVLRNGTQVAAFDESGVWTCENCAFGDAYEFVFTASAADGYAEIHKTKSAVGLMLLLR